jgi:glyoxylase-like metal-dependent hydrolase (beta-lactamase superfamily II)
MHAHVTPFFHAATSTWSHLVRDPGTGEAAVIDPALDFDQASGEVSHASAAAILQAAERGGARVRWILETHAHADHLTAAAWLKERTGAQTAIGAGIVQVQETFRQRLGLDADEPHLGGSAFDRLLHDGDELPLGELHVRALATPGHTPDGLSYLVGDAVFVLAHDYPPAGEAPRAEVPVAEQRASNKHIREGIDEATFVAMRQQRDASLPPPRLLWPALQVNIRGGRLPPPEANGHRYFKLPVRIRD